MLFTFIFIYSIYNIYILGHNHSNNKKEIKEIQEEIILNKEEIVEQEENNSETAVKKELELDFDKLNQMNSDTIGWIRIPNTNINYPIVQSTNNEYYLTHSFYKEENDEGWIFLNYLNSYNLKDPNTIIFGHDTHGNNMFSDLKKLYDGLLGNYIPITIYTKENTYHYDTFAIFLVEEESNQFLNAILTEDDIQDALNNSKYNFGVEVNKENKILTLSTCYHSSKQKVILLAKQK